MPTDSHSKCSLPPAGFHAVAHRATPKAADGTSTPARAGCPCADRARQLGPDRAGLQFDPVCRLLWIHQNDFGRVSLRTQSRTKLLSIARIQSAKANSVLEDESPFRVIVAHRGVLANFLRDAEPQVSGQLGDLQEAGSIVRRATGDQKRVVLPTGAVGTQAHRIPGRKRGRRGSLSRWRNS